MTDIKQLKALLTTWGVPFEETRDRISVAADDGEKRGPLDGYSGFYVEFTFRPEGTFDSMGIWE